MGQGIIRRIEDWSTPRRGLAVLTLAAAGIVAHTVLAPEANVLAYASFAGGAVGVFVYAFGTWEQCEACDEQVSAST